MDQTGCLTCRKRHRKCDEGKPICQLCQKTGRRCEYGSGIRWSSMDRPGHTTSQRIGMTTPTEKLSRHRRTSTAESNSSASSHRQQATQVDLSSFEHVSFDAHQVPDPATTQSVMWDVPFAGFEMVTQPPLGGGDLSWSDLFAGRQCLGPNQSTLGTDHPTTSGEDDTQLTQWYCDDFLLGTSSDTDAAGTRDLLYKDVSQDTVPMSPPQLGRWLSATLESSSEKVAFNHCKYELSLLSLRNNQSHGSDRLQ
jgi:hypothetical protein